MKTKKNQISKLIVAGETDPTTIAKKTNSSLFYVRQLMRPAKRYTTLLVGRTAVMAKALAKLRLRYGTQKAGVERAILDLTKKAA